jgi:pimeloyl-ACP methyl ester carboxylesterase
VLPDLRGHGRGIRTPRRFRLADCADDIAALADTLGIEKAIVCGYSLGGPVAQLVWRRHPDLVDGLVLAATADCFVDRTRDRVVFTSMMMAATGMVGLAGFALRIPSSPTRRLPSVTRDGRARTIQRWALGEMRRHDWRTVMDAGRALGTYDARAWIDKVDVPTAIVLTNEDVAVPPATQLAMASRIPGASVHPVDGGHTVCVTGGLDRPLIEACHSVAGRARPVSAAASPAG